LKEMDLRLIVAKCVGLNGDEGLIEVSISGHPGSGTSTLVHKLSEHFGWKFMNGGDVFRNEAANRSLSLPEFAELCKQDESVDRYLDDLLKKAMVEDDGPEIFESRLAGWWAKEMSPNCSRIWIHVEDDVRASRVAEREGISIEKAIEANAKRSMADSNRFLKMYGIDIESKEPYTHEIDATNLSKEEVLVEVLEHLGAEQ